MNIDFIKMSPAENTTVLVTSVCPKRHYIKVAKRAMGYKFLYAEQVGFIRPSKYKNAILCLEMAGGEFCGNATLSAAAYAKYKGLIEKEDFYIEVSGVENPVWCKVMRKEKFNYYAKCQMPFALNTEEYKINLRNQIIQGGIIKFDGISHFVFPVSGDFTDFTEVLKTLKRDVDDIALGIIPYKTLENQKYEIKPYVYVKKTNSSVYERGCGSGSLALGIFLNQKDKKQRCIEVIQPGGTIEVEIGNRYYISTDVLITCEGMMFI